MFLAGTLDAAMERFRGIYNQMYCDLPDCGCPGCVAFLEDMRDLFDWVYMKGWSAGKMGGE